MSDSHTLKLNLPESSRYSDNDDDDFQSVSSNLGEDQDTYRVLDEAVISHRHLYGPEISNTNNQGKHFVELPEPSQENRSWHLVDNCENTGPINSLFPERLAETVDTKMLQAMDVLPVREMEELEKERDYQLEMKKRISEEVQWDNNYSLPVVCNNDDNNNNITNSREDQVGHQRRYIDLNQQNPTTVDDGDDKEENLYDSLDAEQPSKTHEFGPFPTSSNPLQPAFNEDNLDQFYPKSPQKELKSTGPVKGDHMIFSQMWTDEELYHEFEKMANDYNKNQGQHVPNLVYQPNQGNENYMPPLPSPIPDFQGSNPSDYQHGSKEKFWNNLSKKQQMPKQNPISIDFVQKPKTVPKASTNYVEYNKINYSKINQNQSYRSRHYFRKDISGSLSKIPLERKVFSGRSEPIPGAGPGPLLQKPSSAEDTWKKRSAKLLYQMEKKLPPPPGKLQKYPSDSRVNYRNSRPHYLQPLKPDVQPSALVPVDQRLGMSSPSVMELEPISKDFLMEDGQRISVDISLKLMTPPVSSRMPKDEMNTGIFQALPPFYVNEQAHQAMNLKNLGATIPPIQQEQFSLQALPDLSSEYQGPKNTDATLNSKVGYVARYQRQRDPKPNYKVYSVDDYRKMQKEVKLGKLGPDLDSETLREKVEKRQKQIEYAKKIYEANKDSLKSRKPAGTPQPQSFITEEQRNRRKLAIEYAKSVPKPVVKPTVQEENMPRELSSSSQNQLPVIVDAKPQNTKSKNQLINCEELEKLCLRHEQDKRNAENIRKKITPPS